MTDKNKHLDCVLSSHKISNEQAPLAANAMLAEGLFENLFKFYWVLPCIPNCNYADNRIKLYIN